MYPALLASWETASAVGAVAAAGSVAVTGAEAGALRGALSADVGSAARTAALAVPAGLAGAAALALGPVGLALGVSVLSSAVMAADVFRRKEDEDEDQEGWMTRALALQAQSFDNEITRWEMAFEQGSRVLTLRQQECRKMKQDELEPLLWAKLAQDELELIAGELNRLEEERKELEDTLGRARFETETREHELLRLQLLEFEKSQEIEYLRRQEFLQEAIFSSEAASEMSVAIMCSPGQNYIGNRTDIDGRAIDPTPTGSQVLETEQDISDRPTDPKGNGSGRPLQGVLGDLNKMMELCRYYDLDPSAWYALGSPLPKTIWLSNFLRPFLNTNKSLLVLYYAGHGDRNQGGLVLNDAETLHFTELLEEFDHIADRDKLLLLLADSCHSGRLCEMHQEMLKNATRQDDVANRVAVLAASLPRQTAKEDKGSGGIFTTWLLGWIQTKALQDHLEVSNRYKPQQYTTLFRLHELGNFQTACCSIPAQWMPWMHERLIAASPLDEPMATQATYPA